MPDDHGRSPRDLTSRPHPRNTSHSSRLPRATTSPLHPTNPRRPSPLPRDWPSSTCGGAWRPLAPDAGTGALILRPHSPCFPPSSPHGARCGVAASNPNRGNTVPGLGSRAAPSGVCIRCPSAAPGPSCRGGKLINVLTMGGNVPPATDMPFSRAGTPAPCQSRESGSLCPYPIRQPRMKGRRPGAMTASIASSHLRAL